ncbi:hypothetical protein ELI43_27925 (plasmid) [Rhizobium leguminosarum]|nr:hypothetical protein ELI43_27925 [Rhizobium leguminosarum]
MPQIRGKCGSKSFVRSNFATGINARPRLERRASFWTHKGRSNTFNPRIVLSEHRFRFSGRCACVRTLSQGERPALVHLLP